MHLRLQHTTSLTCRQVLNSAPLSNGEHLPVAFALLVRQYGSTPERKWRWRRGCHDTALFDQNQAIALAMRISPTHPAAILGVIVRDPRAPPSRPVRAVWKPGSCDSPSSRSSRAVSRLSPPHVGAAPETAGRTTRAAAWLAVFGLLIPPDNAVTVVAHFPHAAGAHWQRPRQNPPHVRS